jgi:hypothetical protein
MTIIQRFTAPTDDRRTVIPIRREAGMFSGWGVKV